MTRSRRERDRDRRSIRLGGSRKRGIRFDRTAVICVRGRGCMEIRAHMLYPHDRRVSDRVSHCPAILCMWKSSGGRHTEWSLSQAFDVSRFNTAPTDNPLIRIRLGLAYSVKSPRVSPEQKDRDNGRQIKDHFCPLISTFLYFATAASQAPAFALQFQTSASRDSQSMGRCMPSA